MLAGSLQDIKKIDYLVEMPDKRKTRRVFHINLLKKWETAATVCSLVEEVNEEEFPDWKTTQLMMGAHLSQQQKQEIEQVLSEFEYVLQAKPGRTSVSEHVINTDSKPIMSTSL